MGVFYETIPETLIDWIRAQNVFWVATAPLSGSGHVNVSPKGGKYFGVLDERTFWYLDLSGSGNETISHLIEPGNGRITIQMNEFKRAAPKIVRLWGHGLVLPRESKDFNHFVESQDLHDMLRELPGHRSVIIVDIHQVGSSCGFSVPYMDHAGFRTTLNDVYAKKDKKFREGNKDESMERYWSYKNSWSIDKLPGLPNVVAYGKRNKIEPITKMVGPRAPQTHPYTKLDSNIMIFMMIVWSFLAGVLITLHFETLLGLITDFVPPAMIDLLTQAIPQTKA
ncbi:hypothetical protein LTS14_005011 [Recurvomyces mirabilis]|uniref:uncharacterized protein n=1 Tax=Recurvomyces mirabilis TaxID=574656 RepID=UPI002DE17BF3|nr:hypothetical protein LTS14_005011 [Recurvomyces mirabilis]